MHRRFLPALLFVVAACGDPTPRDQHDFDGGVALDDGVDVSSEPDAGTEPDLSVDVGGDASTEERRHSVFEPGAYNVGHRRWDITYDAELEPDREIRLSVWYPTRDEEGLAGRYLVSLKREEVFRDASVAIDEPAPVLIFSHGNSSLAEQSYFMTEFFASHGWIVVAPYHTGNTVLDDQGGINFSSAPLRPQDITASLDELYGLPEDDPLHGLLSDDVVMSGHSFGGFTTLAVTGGEFAVDTIIEQCNEPDAPSDCSMLDIEGVEELFRRGFLDERIDVAIPQAPGGFFVFLDGLSAIDVPTLLFTGALDATLPAAQEGNPIWAALQGRHMRVDLLAGGHFTFSNMCILLPQLDNVIADGCSEDFIDAELAFELINAYSLAFARHILWGDTSNDDLLRGIDARYAEDVTLSYKPGSDLN